MDTSNGTGEHTSNGTSPDPFADVIASDSIVAEGRSTERPTVVPDDSAGDYLGVGRGARRYRPLRNSWRERSQFRHLEAGDDTGALIAVDRVLMDTVTVLGRMMTALALFALLYLTSVSLYHVVRQDFTEGK